MRLLMLATATLALASVASAQVNFVDASGFESFPGMWSSYRLHEEKVTWKVANITCKLEGGHLIIIDTEEEVATASLIIARVPPFNPPMPWGYDIFHVGITDEKTEGLWVSVLGEPIAVGGHNVWRAGEPNNWDNAEHCGAISRIGKLSDLRCSGDVNHVCPFICEKEQDLGENFPFDATVAEDGR